MRELEQGYRAAPAQEASRLPLAWHLEQLDERLAQAGVPPMSAYWKREAARFYGHPTAKLLVECVGRGGDKSRTSTKMAIAEVLKGEFRIPPGERHYFTHIAENRDEARKTLSVLEQFLRILDVQFSRAGDTIELAEIPRGFKVLACRVGAVSGYRCLGWTGDECAKWNTEGSDPTAEVIASIRAMTVTHPGARGRMFSSPLGMLDHFYTVWSLGNSTEQLTGHAASWEANPTITEEQTRRLERDERKWKREYKAIPLEGSEESLISPTLLDRATRSGPLEVLKAPGITYVAAMDPALVRNAWTFAVACRRWVINPAGPTRIKRSVVLTREWRGSARQPLRPDVILAHIAQDCRRYGIDVVDTDEFHGQSLQVIAERPEIDLMVRVIPTTAPQKIERYESLLTWLSDDEVDLPPDPQVRADLLGVRRVITPNGWVIRLSETPDGRHCDHASSIPLALQKAVYDPDESVSAAPFGDPRYYAEQQERLVANMERMMERRSKQAGWP